MGPQIEGKFWESDNLLRVGRLENMEIVLNDSSVSRRHAEVAASEQGWVVRDLGSTNGTYLNGVRVGRADRKLRQRDVVQFGNLVMVVAVLEEEVISGSETPSAGMQVQATTQNSWEKALEVAVFDDRSRPRAGDRLLTLLRASHHLCHLGAIDELLRSILDDVVAALDAQRGAIVLMDDSSGQLMLRAVSTGERITSGRAAFSRSLAQRSFNRGESLLCRDVSNTPELLMANSIADGTMSSIICALLRSPRNRLGVLHLDRGPFQDPFTQDDLNLADALAASVSAGIESAQLLEKQRELFLQTVTALAQSIELRDQYTGGHTKRVTDYSMLLAEEMKLSPPERQHLQIGTPLHDIGKIGIDDSVLRKAGKLTPDEFEHMKTHTLKGAAMLEAIPDLAPIIPIVRSHHERWDGKGYPDGLVEDQIPKLARIVAVADAFDAMTSERPYRTPVPLAVAFGEISDKAGIQFDPEAARAFIRMRERVEELFSLNMGSLAETILPDVSVLETNEPPTAQLRPAAAG
jgi:HD-GYP domain-containing protein (c-di-GMP phosphodiesterase class II)/pSer/pThr/pTyr-binding forkhead associated (FHA) protein